MLAALRSRTTIGFLRLIASNPSITIIARGRGCHIGGCRCCALTRRGTGRRRRTGAWRSLGLGRLTGRCLSCLRARAIRVRTFRSRGGIDGRCARRRRVVLTRLLSGGGFATCAGINHNRRGRGLISDRFIFTRAAGFRAGNGRFSLLTRGLTLGLIAAGFHRISGLCRS